MTSLVVVIIGSIIGRFIGQKVYDIYKAHKSNNQSTRRSTPGERR